MSTAIETSPVYHRDPKTENEYGSDKNGSSLEENHLEPPEESFDDHDVTKPFPIDQYEIEETHQLSFRAIAVGCLLGAVVGASNIYLGLKTGFTFGPQLFGAIFGYVILKALSTLLPRSGLLGFLGGEFGPKENCTVQSAATAAGGLGILFVSAVPAMYRLGLLSDLPTQDIGKLIGLTACAGFFGVFFVIPLRKYFIIHQKLTFPTPAATAYTIRSLHRGKAGAIAARKKSIALLWSFGTVFIFKVLTGYAPGIIYDWHVGWTLYRLGFTSMINVENYGWILEFTPAFFGAGMLSGLNASWSFFGGSVLAWGIMAPLIVHTGKAFGRPASEEYPLISYVSMSFSDPETYTNTPSPRYWLLWPGVMIMLLYSFADIAFTIVPIVKNMSFSKEAFDPRGWFKKQTELTAEDEDQTPSRIVSPPSGGLLVFLPALLSLILGFVFSFIGVQSSGYTDVNPVSTVAKASQLIFGGISKGAGLQPKPAQTINLAAGVVAAGSAAQASDMTGDLKTGYLLRAKPKNQFIAQLCGSVVAVFINCGLFILFTKASPCIINPPEDGSCTYSAPSVNAWAAVAVAVTAPKLPISRSSGLTSIGLGIAAVLTLVIRNLFIPKKYWGYVPNWNAIGLAFVVPQVYYSIAMAVGSVFNHIWQLRNPGSFDMYMFAVSAGMLAGEGLGGVFQALLAIIGVDGGKYGTAIGCPGLEYCG
ncbi:hypothetical protein D9619_007896 [Psilocybe cf. subviscida]|uniref:OPT superfamily oligopeptide transporter n=1 Tax=Psilocybe cf. subviscida TaxID=2480587 RepID=A0A8H5ATQ1_9AGAR|nr:hypothetical protein D9619_007896 [Psilocybe cf. subviscida]